MGQESPLTVFRNAKLNRRPTKKLVAFLTPFFLSIGWGGIGEALASSSPISILPLGDSITYGYSVPAVVPGGYRGTLYSDLTSAGYNVQLVGSLTDNPPPSLPAAADSHDGYKGYLIAGVDGYTSFSVNGSTIDQALAPGNGINPNLILLQLGTNEILGNYHVTSAPYELAALITHILELRPNAEILVSTIPPIENALWNTEATAFNKALSGPNGIIAQLQAEGENVRLVNVGGSLTLADLGGDGIHPSAEGYAKMGNAWAAAVESALLVPHVVPEPSTFILFGVGLVGLFGLGRTRARVATKGENP